MYTREMSPSHKRVAAGKTNLGKTTRIAFSDIAHTHIHRHASCGNYFKLQKRVMIYTAFQPKFGALPTTGC